MKNKLLYICLSYCVQFLNIVLNLLFMQRLPPLILGDLAIAKIWLQAFDYSHIGTRFALDRYLPVVKRDDHRHLYLIISLSVVAFTSLAIFCTSLFMGSVNVTVFSFCLVGISLAFFNVIKAYFRATGSIQTVNKVMAWLYIFPLSLSVIASLQSFTLFLWVYPISFWTCLLLFSLKYGSFVFIKINHLKMLVVKRKVSKASKVLFLNSIVVYATFIIDRLFVDLSLGREALGYYSVITFVFASLIIAPSILTELIFPKIIYRVVNEGKIFFYKEMAFVFAGTLFSVVIANVLMYFLVNRFTPYGHLVPLMQVASFGVLPYAFIAIFNHVFNARDKRGLLFFINAALFGLYILALIGAYFSKQIEIFIFVKVFYGMLLLGAMLFALKRLND